MCQRRTALLLLVSVWGVLSAHAQPAAGFSGVVIEQQSRRPIASLQVKLIPRRSSGIAVKVATTDAAGRFSFPGAPRSVYLLEIGQGMNLLYRAEIDTATQNRVVVQLRRK